MRHDARLLVALAACLALAACASPRDRCISTAQAELRTVEALIAETEANIARGYALVMEPGVRSTLEFCYSPDNPFVFCTHDIPTVTERPVAIDRAEERRKLASLRERRMELIPATTAAIAQCQALYPAA